MCVCLVCFRSPADEDVVHDSFSQLIEEQSQDLNSNAEEIEMYPLKEETSGIFVYTHTHTVHTERFMTYCHNRI